MEEWNSQTEKKKLDLDELDLENEYNACGEPRQAFYLLVKARSVMNELVEYL